MKIKKVIKPVKPNTLQLVGVAGNSGLAKSRYSQIAYRNVVQFQVSMAQFELFLKSLPGAVASAHRFSRGKRKV